MDAPREPGCAAGDPRAVLTAINGAVIGFA